MSSNFIYIMKMRKNLKKKKKRFYLPHDLSQREEVHLQQKLFHLEIPTMSGQAGTSSGFLYVSAWKLVKR